MDVKHLFPVLLLHQLIVTRTLSDTTHGTNVLGNPLEICSLSPLTGYTRTGYCETPNGDYGNHAVCSQVTNEFLNYTKGKGNDLTQRNSYFPGLKHGDRWCLCSMRWKEAALVNKAPFVVLEATSIASLVDVSVDEIRRYNAKKFRDMEL